MNFKNYSIDNILKNIPTSIKTFISAAALYGIVSCSDANKEEEFVCPDGYTCLQDDTVGINIGTDTISIGTDTVATGTDTIADGTDKIPTGTDTVAGTDIADIVGTDTQPTPTFICPDNYTCTKDSEQQPTPNPTVEPTAEPTANPTVEPTPTVAECDWDGIGSIVDSDKEFYCRDGEFLFGGGFDYLESQGLYDLDQDGDNDTFLWQVHNDGLKTLYTDEGEQVFGGPHNGILSYTLFDIDNDGIEDILYKMKKSNDKYSFFTIGGEELTSFGGEHDWINYFVLPDSSYNFADVPLLKAQDDGKQRLFFEDGTVYSSFGGAHEDIDSLWSHEISPGNEEILLRAFNNDKWHYYTQDGTELATFGGGHDILSGIHLYDLDMDGTAETPLLSATDNNQFNFFKEDGSTLAGFGLPYANVAFTDLEAYDLDDDGKLDELVMHFRNNSQDYAYDSTGNLAFGSPHDQMKYADEHEINGEEETEILLYKVVNNELESYFDFDGNTYWGEHDDFRRIFHFDNSTETLAVAKDDGKDRIFKQNGTQLNKFGGAHDRIEDADTYRLGNLGEHNLIIAHDNNKAAIIQEDGTIFPYFGAQSYDDILDLRRFRTDGDDVVIASVINSGLLNLISHDGSVLFTAPEGSDPEMFDLQDYELLDTDNDNIPDLELLVFEDDSTGNEFVYNNGQVVFGGPHRNIYSIRMQDTDGDDIGDTLLAHTSDKGIEVFRHLDGSVYEAFGGSHDDIYHFGELTLNDGITQTVIPYLNAEDDDLEYYIKSDGSFLFGGGFTNVDEVGYYDFNDDGLYDTVLLIGTNTDGKGIFKTDGEKFFDGDFDEIHDLDHLDTDDNGTRDTYFFLATKDGKQGYYSLDGVLLTEFGGEHDKIDSIDIFHLGAGNTINIMRADDNGLTGFFNRDGSIAFGSGFERILGREYITPAGDLTIYSHIEPVMLAGNATQFSVYKLDGSTIFGGPFDIPEGRYHSTIWPFDLDNDGTRTMFFEGPKDDKATLYDTEGSEVLGFGLPHDNIGNFGWYDSDSDGTDDLAILVAENDDLYSAFLQDGSTVFGEPSRYIRDIKEYDFEFDGTSTLYASVRDADGYDLVDLASNEFAGFGLPHEYLIRIWSLDMNADGSDDLYLAQGENDYEQSLYQLDGSTMFGGPYNYITNVFGFDEDGDGQTDVNLIEASPLGTDTFSLYRLDGTQYDAFGVPHYDINNIKWYDLNADGSDDIVLMEASVDTPDVQSYDRQEAMYTLDGQISNLFGGPHDRIEGINLYDLDADGTKETLLMQAREGYGWHQAGEIIYYFDDGSIAHRGGMIYECGLKAGDDPVCKVEEDGSIIYKIIKKE